MARPDAAGDAADRVRFYQLDAPADDDRLSVDAISRRILAGFAAAAVIIQLHGWITGGPGLAAIFS